VGEDSPCEPPRVVEAEAVGEDSACEPPRVAEADAVGEDSEGEALPENCADVSG